MKRNSGLTLIEVMIAVAIASTICAIGFTGVIAFGRSITRAKQFVSQTELITTAIRAAIASADATTTPSSRISPATLNEFSGGAASMTAMTATRVPVPIASARIPTPKNWMICALINDSAIPAIAANADGYTYPPIPGVPLIPNASILVFYLDIERMRSGFSATTTEIEALSKKSYSAIITGNVSKALNMSQISCRNTLTIQSLPCKW